MTEPRLDAAATSATDDWRARLLMRDDQLRALLERTRRIAVLGIKTPESGQPAFYVPTNSPPEMGGVLARALLKAPDHKLALLPAGEASIELRSAGD